MSCQNDKGAEIYAPQYLTTVATPSTTSVAPKPFPLVNGNPTLDYKLSDYVKIRDRFK